MSYLLNKIKENPFTTAGLLAGALVPVIGVKYLLDSCVTNDTAFTEALCWGASLFLNGVLCTKKTSALPIYTGVLGATVGVAIDHHLENRREARDNELEQRTTLAPGVKTFRTDEEIKWYIDKHLGRR